VLSSRGDFCSRVHNRRLSLGDPAKSAIFAMSKVTTFREGRSGEGCCSKQLSEAQLTVDVSNGPRDTMGYEPAAPLRQPTKADWTNHRTIITQLYLNEGRSMNDMRTIMERKYKFKAT
jgi:hypothetical protein